jgi:hypothetical protein
MIEKDSPSIMPSAASGLMKIGVALVAVALAAVGSGCSFTAATNSAGNENGMLNPGDSGVGDSSGGIADAAHDHQPALGYEGSPLCNASRGRGCYPDNPATPQLCNLAPDGGTYDPKASYNKDGVLACRVQRDGSTIKPVCESAGYGTDGVACTMSTDCSAGYECAGTGHCQHYCCDGVCPGGPNVNGKDLFCDIQPISEATSVKVPVCSVVNPCTLLASPTGCGDTETCSVVRGDGTTSCVTVGPQKAGDDCEYDHCGRNLVCLGVPGLRKCFALCHVDAPVECSQPQKCMTELPLFQDPSIGVCE